MNHIITEADKTAILQQIVQYKYRFFIQDDKNNILKVLENFTPSVYTINTDSQVRRTIQIEINELNNVEEMLNMYMRLNFVFQIGVFSYIKNDYIWYDCGTYVMTESNTIYDSTTNTLSSTLMDSFAKMDGTRNGQVGGAPTIVIEQKDSNGNIVTIQRALSNLITSENITENMIIDDIGEFYGIQATNPDGYLEYRKNNPDWNKMPYDLEFSAGDTQATMIGEFSNLYPNIQIYWDIYNNLCCNMIPSCEHDPIIIDNDFFQKVLISENSENTTYDISLIKNVTEVFGKIYDVDRNAESCTVQNNCFNANLKEYDSYSSYEVISFSPTITNSSSPTFKINNLQSIPIYDEYTTIPIKSGTIVANEINSIRLHKTDTGYVAYYLGQFQPHALCVLTGDIDDEKYTKEYFQKKYNCDNVVLRLEKDSPYTVQKIGEVLDVKTDEEFDNIMSNTVAIQNAIYFNKKSSSMKDTVQLSTKLIPWIYENCKVEYAKGNSIESEQYIIKNISHDLDNCTSTITLQRFYPLYYD